MKCNATFEAFIITTKSRLNSSLFDCYVSLYFILFASYCIISRWECCCDRVLYKSVHCILNFLLSELWTLNISYKDCSENWKSFYFSFYLFNFFFSLYFFKPNAETIQSLNTMMRIFITYSIRFGSINRQVYRILSE